MSWEAWITLATTAGVFVALARRLAGPDVILSGGAVVLTTLSLVSDAFLSPGEFALTFGNEGLLTIAALFVVAAGLTETGAVELVAERLLGRPTTERRAVARLTLPAALLSSVMNNTPVVAMLVPIVGDWAKKLDMSPSKLLMPLSFASILGGACTLIGTSTNLVVQGLLFSAQQTDPAIRTMGMFTISAVGLPVAVVGLLYLVLMAPRLLVERRSVRSALENAREYTTEMLVEAGSAIDGRSIEAAGLRHLPGVYLASIERRGEALAAVDPGQLLEGGDRLVFVGVVDSVVDLQKVRGLVPATDQVRKLSASRLNRCLIEAVVSDRNPVVGRTVREGRFRNVFDAAIIAVHRHGRRVHGKIGDIVLESGDALLMQAHPRFVEKNRDSPHFLLVSPVLDSRPRRHEHAGVALAIVGGLLVAVAAEPYTGIGPFQGSLIAAALMGLLRCCSAEQARRSVDLSLLLAVGSALAIGQTMARTGLAGALAETVLGQLSALGPWAVLGGVYLMTLLFTEVVTNNAAAAISFPIAQAAAASLGVDFMPFAIVVAIAASAGFATPLGYQTHLMVYGPGGYQFGDFVKVGVPLDVIVMIVTVALAPYMFPF